MRRYKSLGKGKCNFWTKRDVHKSVRMDDRIYRYIMKTDGSCFADKLENLVIEHAGLTDCVSDLV